MRGKAEQRKLLHRKKRITPAYAGKRISSKCCGNLFWDHPRLCGEKHSATVIREIKLGSPPPMRGKVPKDGTAKKADGDHPRLCGEKDTVERFQFHFVRITPAYAGKSGLNPACMPAKKDHPRLCGEKRYSFRKICNNLGSPPPMRGKEIATGHRCTAGGITPAYAGKSYNRENDVKIK